jgi:hypothetical protein
MKNKVFIGIVGAVGLSLVPAPAMAEEEQEGIWSLVDDDGNVFSALVCTESVCGEGGEFDQLGGFANAGQLPEGQCDNGCNLVFQQPGHSGFATDGYIDVEYNFETENHEISEPLIVDDQIVGRQTTIVPKGQGESQSDPKIISPDKIVPEPKDLETSEELPVSADIEIAKGFLDKDSNYVEIDVETTERSLLLEYSDGNDAVENISKDILGEEGLEEELEESKSPLAEFVETVVGFIRSIFNL